jgi:uncharacterized protein YkwD
MTINLKFLQKKISPILLALFFVAHNALASNVTADLEDQKNILADINAYRSAHSLGALTLNAVISEEATKHSQAMADQRVSFGHEGFETRMHNIFSRFENPLGIAENVAYTSADAKTVTQQWLASSGHRKNIEGDYNLTGIGIAHDLRGRVYVTQIFLSAKNADKS